MEEMFDFDEKQMTFKYLREDEKLVLTKEIRALVVDGIPCPESDFFRAWCEKFGFDDRQRLLVMTTAYPQRAMLALI